MDIDALMEEIGEALESVPSLAGRSFPHPVDDMNSPAGVVPFPRVDYDLAKGGGLDQIDFEVVVLVSRSYDRAARGLLVPYINRDGAESIKAALEAHTWVHADLAHVSRTAIQPYTMADVSYWAAVAITRFFDSGTTS